MSSKLAPVYQIHDYKKPLCRAYDPKKGGPGTAFSCWLPPGHEGPHQTWDGEFEILPTVKDAES